MKVKRLIAVASLVFLSCSTSAECIVSDPSKKGEAYEFYLSDSECKLVRYSGGGVVTMFVEYPSMKIVNERAVDDSLMIFRLVHISKATFNQDATTENKHPTSVHDGIEKYGEGEGAFFRFIGGDGNPIFVSNWPNSRSARHLFSDEIQIRYQYALKHKDLKAMDEFALDFVKKITRK